MTVRFTVPATWRGIATDMPAVVTCDAHAGTVGEALEWFVRSYPVLRPRVLTTEGTIAPWTVVVLDGADVRTIAALNTTITPADDDHEIHILSAFMGG